MFKYLLYLYGQTIVNILPLSFLEKLATFLSDVQYYFSPRDRNAVESNLLEIHGCTKDVSKSAREVFRNFGKYLLEFFYLEKMANIAYIKKHVDVENLEYLQQAVSKNKGVILLTAHLGNWEFGGIAISLLGYPLMAVALPHKERPVNRFFNKKRALGKITIVQTHHALKKCVEVVQKKGIVALVADRSLSGKGEPMLFLGRTVMVPKGPALIAQKTGAAIVPVFMLRKGDRKFCLQLSEPIYPLETMEEKSGVKLLMEKYKLIMEKMIRQHSEQWLMFRKYGVEN